MTLDPPNELKFLEESAYGPDQAKWESVTLVPYKIGVLKEYEVELKNQSKEDFGDMVLGRKLGKWTKIRHLFRHGCWTCKREHDEWVNHPLKAWKP